MRASDGLSSRASVRSYDPESPGSANGAETSPSSQGGGSGGNKKSSVCMKEGMKLHSNQL